MQVRISVCSVVLPGIEFGFVVELSLVSVRARLAEVNEFKKIKSEMVIVTEETTQIGLTIQPGFALLISLPI